MKATIKVASLASVLSRAQRVVEKRNTIPILANILLDAKASGTLEVRTTDLDIEFLDSISADIPQPGSTTVSAHIFHDIVRKLPADAEMGIEVVDRMLKVKSGRSRFSLNTLPIEDFPTLTVGEFATTFMIDGPPLLDLVNKVEFAISHEETRYYLNGIYFHIITEGNQKYLTAVSTDGHRLARSRMPAPEGTVPPSGQVMAGLILPRKTVGEVRQLLAKFKDQVKVELSDTKARFTVGSAILTSKLIDGTFPDYARVIPTGNDKIAKVNRADLVAAANRVATISSERGRAVALELADNKIVLEVNNPDSGHARDELEADYSSDPVKIGFNSHYIHEMVSTIEGETIELVLADPGSPVIFRSAGAKDTLYVLMPMRV